MFLPFVAKILGDFNKLFGLLLNSHQLFSSGLAKNYTFAKQMHEVEVEIHIGLIEVCILIQQF